MESGPIKLKSKNKKVNKAMERRGLPHWQSFKSPAFKRSKNESRNDRKKDY